MDERSLTLAAEFCIDLDDPQFWPKLAYALDDERKPKRPGRPKGIRPSAWKDLVITVEYVRRISDATPGTTRRQIIDEMERDPYLRHPQIRKGRGTIKRILHRYKNDPDAIKNMVANSADYIRWLQTEHSIDFCQWCEALNLKFQIRLGSKK